MTSQKLKCGSEGLYTIWKLAEKQMLNKEVGTKHMWITLAWRLFIYGTHMTRNITANTTTNTQTLVICLANKYSQINVTQIILLQ